jgi:hypothetical protein
LIDTIRNKLINGALLQYKVTIEEILSKYPSGIIPTGVVRNKKPVTDYWYNKYTWENEKDYLVWKEWALEELEKEGMTKGELDKFELIYDLKHQYIFKKEDELF